MSDQKQPNNQTTRQNIQNVISLIPFPIIRQGLLGWRRLLYRLNFGKSLEFNLKGLNT